MRSFSGGWLFVAALLLVACEPGTDTGEGGSGGSGGGGGAGGGPPVLEVVPGAPAPLADTPEQATFTMDGYATSAATREGITVAGTTIGAHVAGVDGLTQLPIEGDDPELPAETGIVRAAAPIETGVLVAAEAGLFVAGPGALTLSNGHAGLHPLGILGMKSRLADDDNDGTPEAHLVLLTNAGLVEWSSGETVTWTIGTEQGPPSAAFSRKDLLFAAWGTRVYEVDREGGVAYPLVFDIGAVTDIACSSQACDEGSLVYFATDKGLVERSAEGGYTLYPLAPEGEPGVAVKSFALDAGKQRLYAFTETSVLRVRAGHVPDEVASLGKADFDRHAAVDKAGDLWSFAGGEATRLSTGTPLSFATDIQPIMGEYCAPCHKSGSNGAPAIDFESYDKMLEYADKAVARVQDSSMPPPTWPQVPKDQVQLLVEWVATKAP
ncbi:MAG: hypothetical protein R3B70_01815 [Polyangiaceae bacterium]